MKGEVILLHGLYMHGVVMQPLARRLRKLGWHTQEISYNSLNINTNKLFEQLDQAINEQQPAYLVGHSLGGLLLHRYANQRKLPQGSRVVALGSPLKGALIAKRLTHLRLGAIIGNAGQHGLCDDDVPPWQSRAQLGSIAGNTGMGIGMLVGGMPVDCAHDGTVLVKETELDGMTDHITLPVTHASMLLSDPVAEQTDTFLRQGRFNHYF